MRLRLALGIVGGLIGADVGLLFGVIPAGVLTFAVLENVLSSSSVVSEEAAFVLLWGAFTLMNALLGVAIGLLIERMRRPRDAGPPAPRDDAFSTRATEGDRVPALPR